MSKSVAEPQRSSATRGDLLRMDRVLGVIVLLRCWCVCVSGPFSIAFSGGTQLLVDEHEVGDDRNKTAGSGPSVQILWSAPLPLDPGSAHLLVCVLTGLSSPLQDVRWWVDGEVATSADVSWMRSEGGGAYSATSVLKVPAADWRSRSTYWCGTIQEGQVYRQRVCSGDCP